MLWACSIPALSRNTAACFRRFILWRYNNTAPKIWSLMLHSYYSKQLIVNLCIPALVCNKR